MGASIDPSHVLARFLDDRKRFRSDSVHWRAFLPSREPVETSVLDSHGMNERDIWTWGDTNVSPGRGRPILARAEIPAASATYESLVVEECPPPPAHAAIRGWPSDPLEHRPLCMELAARSRPVPRPSGPGPENDAAPVAGAT